jgi:uncharacterized protein (DUF4415 family)
VAKEKITRVALRDLHKLAPGRTDWARVDALTDADIGAAIAADPDAAPIAGREWFEGATLELPERKQAVSLRIDADVLRWYKGQGAGYQSRINAVLRRYAQAHGASFIAHSTRTRPGKD